MEASTQPKLPESLDGRCDTPDEDLSNEVQEAPEGSEMEPQESVQQILRQQLADLPLSLLPLNQPMTIRQVATEHPVFVIDNFLSPSECQSIIQYGEPKLQPSTTVENDRLVIKDYRNSSTGFISPNGKASPHSAVNEVLKRVSAFSGYPISHLESVNIVRYRVGERYEAHYDYFDPNDTAMMDKAGQRLTTFFVYLNDVTEECGGSTYFPELDLKIQPKVGSCAVWFNTDPSGKILYPHSHHGGEVLQATKNVPNPVKYALNVWVRQNCFCCGEPL